MKIYLLSIVFVLLSGTSTGQIISQFTWESDPVTTADIGPDATAVSTSAISDINGVGGTNGLNAGLPKRDIEMTIPGSPTFDVDGIDVSFDYQREESGGTFVQRGSSLQIVGCANLSVNYRVEDGAGGFNSVSSGNVFSIPFDDVFRTYRFIYLPATGEGQLSVDGVVVWTNDGPDNRNMYWTGSGDMRVGVGMDGTGFNNTFLDNLIFANVFDSPLPVELMNFQAMEDRNDTNVDCTWETLSEVENDVFDVERSHDGFLWEKIGEVDGAGNSSERIYYDFTDLNPYSGVSYYRLRQVDFNGEYEYSDVRSVVFDEKEDWSFFPNPSDGIVQFQGVPDQETPIEIINSLGQSVLTIGTDEFTGSTVEFSVIDLASGVYFLQYGSESKRLVVN